MPVLSVEGMEASAAKLELLNKADRDRVARETALNELQSFVYDLQEKLYEVGMIWYYSLFVIC